MWGGVTGAILVCESSGRSPVRCRPHHDAGGRTLANPGEQIIFVRIAHNMQNYALETTQLSDSRIGPGTDRYSMVGLVSNLETGNPASLLSQESGQSLRRAPIRHREPLFKISIMINCRIEFCVLVHLKPEELARRGFRKLFESLPELFAIRRQKVL